MSFKGRNARQKLEDAISRAWQAIEQARAKGELKTGNREHPAMKHLEGLIKRKVDARARAIRRLKSLDQDKLFEKWTVFGQEDRRGKLSSTEFEKYRELRLHFLDHPHPSVAAIEKQVSDQLDHIARRVKEAIKPLWVSYSAYRTDDLGIPIDNLDDIAVVGQACYLYPPSPDFQCPAYRSPIVKDPTWLQVAQLANEMYSVCELGERVYLEGVDLDKEVDSVKEMYFVMGS